MCAGVRFNQCLTPHLTISNLAHHDGPVSTDESPACLLYVDPTEDARLHPHPCENVVPGRLCDANDSQEACMRACMRARP